MHIFEIHVRSYIFEIHVHARILFAKEKFTYKKCETSAVSHGVISNRSVIRRHANSPRMTRFPRGPPVALSSNNMPVWSTQ